MKNKKLITALMNYNFIILGYRAFIKLKTGNSRIADDFVESYLRDHHIDPVAAGFIPKKED